jgi:hypothetical protein
MLSLMKGHSLFQKYKATNLSWDQKNPIALEHTSIYNIIVFILYPLNLISVELVVDYFFD